LNKAPPAPETSLHAEICQNLASDAPGRHAARRIGEACLDDARPVRAGELRSLLRGLHYPQSWPGRELAWALVRTSWGRGLANEGALAALTHAFDNLHWDRVISLIDPANVRSIRLAQLLGERFERELVRVGLYALDATAWRAA
jgi:hypothetical protein